MALGLRGGRRRPGPGGGVIRDLYEMARLPVPREHSGVRGLARAPWDEPCDDGAAADAADAREALIAAEDEAAANDLDAPTDMALAADESVSAFFDARTADFLDDLAGMVEQPEQFVVCDVARAA